MPRLIAKNALVTGATSGIGLAAAQALAQEGAHVFLVGRRQDALADAVAGIGATQATAIPADVTVPADLDRVAAIVDGSGRRLDVVFANAGINEFAALGALTWEHHRKIFDTNVGGVTFVVKPRSPCCVTVRRSSCAVPTAM